MRILFFVVICVVSTSAAPTTAIKVDQVGYLPASQKLALVVTTQPARQFIVRKADDGDSVFYGRLTSPVYDPDSGDSVQIAGFSELQTEGRYYIEVPGVGTSWTFSIGRLVYRRAFYLALRSFYGQRCGTAVDLGPEFPGFKQDRKSVV